MNKTKQTNKQKSLHWGKHECLHVSFHPAIASVKRCYQFSGKDLRISTLKYSWSTPQACESELWNIHSQLHRHVNLNFETVMVNSTGIWIWTLKYPWSAPQACESELWNVHGKLHRHVNLNFETVMVNCIGMLTQQLPQSFDSCLTESHALPSMDVSL